MIYPQPIIDQLESCDRMTAWRELSGAAYARAVGMRGTGRMDHGWTHFFLEEMRHAVREQERRDAELVAALRQVLQAVDV